MKRIEKIIAVQKEIESFKWKRNGIPFYPLPDKLNELKNLFDADPNGNADLNKQLNDGPIKTINWCIEECKNGIGKEDWWMDRTEIQIKDSCKSAVTSFVFICDSFKPNLLHDKIST